jgi:hypothetical protein
MANMELIETKTAGSGGVSNFDFTSIPATYTDLYILCSLRSSIAANADDIYIQFNNSSSNFNWKNIVGIGSGTPASQNNTNNQVGTIPAASMTASSFGNASIYITNYASANYKSVSGDSVAENNATRGDQAFYAALWSNTAAITSVKLLPSSGTFLEFSSASLYGISNVTSGSKATGGVVSSDGTYWYHTFPFSGTFTPTQSLSADILCIAGGAGGSSAGGGAGGLRYFSSESLTATGYTVTVGAGGALGSSGSTAGSTGGNSQFGSLTLSNGGGGGSNYGAVNSTVNGSAGGSGGGGSSRDSTSTGTGGAASPSGQGNAGGDGLNSSAGAVNSGGGGGAGAVGGNTAFNSGGNGGIGVNTYASWAVATQTGDNGYYAGGGRGQSNFSNSLGQNGLGNGSANTGGGGMCASSGGGNGFAGQSGIVIIRYAI